MLIICVAFILIKVPHLIKRARGKLNKKYFETTYMCSFAQVSHTYAELLMRGKIYFERVFQTTAKLFCKFDNYMQFMLIIPGSEVSYKYSQLPFEKNNTSSKRKESAPFTLD